MQELVLNHRRERQQDTKKSRTCRAQSPDTSPSRMRDFESPKWVSNDDHRTNFAGGADAAGAQPGFILRGGGGGAKHPCRNPLPFSFQPSSASSPLAIGSVERDARRQVNRPYASGGQYTDDYALQNPRDVISASGPHLLLHHVLVPASPRLATGDSWRAVCGNGKRDKTQAAVQGESSLLKQSSRVSRLPLSLGTGTHIGWRPARIESMCTSAHRPSAWAARGNIQDICSEQIRGQKLQPAFLWRGGSGSGPTTLTLDGSLRQQVHLC